VPTIACGSSSSRLTELPLRGNASHCSRELRLFVPPTWPIGRVSKEREQVEFWEQCVDVDGDLGEEPDQRPSVRNESDQADCLKAPELDGLERVVSQALAQRRVDHLPRVPRGALGAIVCLSCLVSHCSGFLLSLTTIGFVREYFRVILQRPQAEQGQAAERLIAAVLRTAGPQGFAGLNPTCPPRHKHGCRNRRWIALGERLRNVGWFKVSLGLAQTRLAVAQSKRLASGKAVSIAGIPWRRSSSTDRF